MKPKTLTFLAGLSLLAPPLLAFLLPPASDSEVHIFYPEPALILVMGFLGLRFVAYAVPMLAFYAWNPGLFAGDVVVPKRSSVLLIIAAVADVFWFIASWKDGLAVQGATYTYSVCAINVVWVILLLAGFAISRKTPASFGKNLLLHLALFAWLAWFAFPFFGEFI
jgi:hypothetical protein